MPKPVVRRARRWPVSHDRGLGVALALLSILCLVVILTVLVVVHEGGHALAARLCGVRVTEFFVGMPFGPGVSRRSKRTGIRYGVTLALLGGYTKIAGMLPDDDPRGPLVLALVNARGSVNVEEVAQVLGCSEEEASEALARLADWGSIEEVWPAGMAHGHRDLPSVYRTVQRDGRGRTVFDRDHDFSAPGTTRAGEPFVPRVSADAFFEEERSHTYRGVGVGKRLIILVAGVVCNIVLALALLVGYCMIVGVPAATGVDPAVRSVVEGSQASSIGMEAGDQIVGVDGVPVATAEEASDALAAIRGAGPVEIVFTHDGVEHRATVDVGADDRLGVYYGYTIEQQRLGLGEALGYSFDYTALVASSVASLLIPEKTGEILQESSGVVGIATLTHDAVASGVGAMVILAAMLSMSLGWMNLLPIPPLDGGKVLIELVQVVLRRPVSLQAQGIANMAGIALFLLLFFYMVVQDVSRIVGA